MESKWFSMEVIGVHWETPLLMSLKLTLKLEEGRFDFQAGQYAKILCPDGRETYFAMASEPEEKHFVEFLVKDQAGSAAHDLCQQVKAGDYLKVSPPFGRGYPMERLKAKDILLIGIGTGISPLRSLLKSILRREQQFGKITLLYGVRTSADVPYQSEFDFWRKKLNVEIAISQPHGAEWSSFKGRVTHLIPKLSLHPDKTVACVCGTEAMEEEVTNLLERAGISKDNILLNLER